jgi:hypothetical protein
MAEANGCKMFAAASVTAQLWRERHTFDRQPRLTQGERPRALV